MKKEMKDIGVIIKRNLLVIKISVSSYEESIKGRRLKTLECGSKGFTIVIFSCSNCSIKRRIKALN